MVNASMTVEQQVKCVLFIPMKHKSQFLNNNDDMSFEIKLRPILQNRFAHDIFAFVVVEGIHIYMYHDNITC